MVIFFSHRETIVEQPHNTDSDIFIDATRYGVHELAQRNFYPSDELISAQKAIYTNSNHDMTFFEYYGELHQIYFFDMEKIHIEALDGKCIFFDDYYHMAALKAFFEMHKMSVEILDKDDVAQNKIQSIEKAVRQEPNFKSLSLFNKFPEKKSSKRGTIQYGQMTNYDLRALCSKHFDVRKQRCSRNCPIYESVGEDCPCPQKVSEHDCRIEFVLP